MALKPTPAHRFILFLLTLLVVVGFSARAAAATDPIALAAEIFDRPADGISVRPLVRDLPGAEIRQDGRTIGYLASSWRTIGSVGYSGKPVDVWLGIDLEARVVGARLVAHEEPILVIGVTPEELERYVLGFSGMDLKAGDLVQVPEAAGMPDAVSGATVSSAVIRDAVLRTGRAVASARGLFGSGTGSARIDRASFEPAKWPELLAEGGVVTRRVSRGEVARALGTDDQAAAESPDDLFVEMFAALATPPSAGQNLLGRRLYESMIGEIGPEDDLLMIAANGLYSFKGTQYRKSGLFERIELRQDDRIIRLGRDGYRNVERIAADGAPELREIGAFVVPNGAGFDATQPWALALLVSRDVAGAGQVTAAFELTYRPPDRFVQGGKETSPEVASPAPVLWQEIWRARVWEIGFLVLLLGGLSVILIFQDALARRYRLYRTVRLGYLAVVLVWLGWIAGAQLSVVNVITFAQALLTGFKWELFLLDPLVFILWGFVAVGLLFWGRGVFCGWLCPFGALQELLNAGAKLVRIPQVSVPFAVHERLWPIKYIAFLAIFALSLHSVTLAFQAAEVEPFKTVISLKFIRDWPFVVYALLLLVAGLFVQRFFCRYLCPLGAALAIPARLRMFEWLKRRMQCGRECRICATRCPVQAIHPLGQINPNECIHCLNCQTLYYDPKTCPPLKARAERRARRSEAA